MSEIHKNCRKEEKKRKIGKIKAIQSEKRAAIAHNVDRVEIV
jgi:hypothetical protein